MSPHHPRRTSELLTGRQTARILDIHENTVRNWADAGILPVAEVLPGTRYRRYDPADVERLKRRMATRTLPEELYAVSRQITEQLHTASGALPMGEQISPVSCTASAFSYIIERGGNQYVVWVAPLGTGALQ